MLLCMSSLRAHAAVAQLDRVTGYEPVGQGFESLPARHKKQYNISCAVFYFALKVCGTRTPLGEAEHNRVSEPASAKGVALRVPSSAPKKTILRNRLFLSIAKAMVYHHTLVCISSLKAYIINRRLYSFHNDEIQSVALMIYNFCKIDDMHGYRRDNSPPRRSRTQIFKHFISFKTFSLFYIDFFKSL